MEALNSIVKIIFLGIEGAGMPTAILIYTIWSSVKNSGKIGFSLYSGHFLAEALILIIASLSNGFLLQESFFSSLICFVNAVVCLVFGVTLAIVAFKDKDLKTDYEISERDKKKYEKQYKNIYDLNKDESYDIAEAIKENEKNKKLSKARRKAFLASFFLTVSSLSIIRFLTSSISSLIFQTNLNFGIKNYTVTMIIFAIIFMLSEFILYFFLPKIISIFRRWINEILMKILTGATALGFLLCAVNQIIMMISEIKFM